MIWTLLKRGSAETLGFLPMMLSEKDERSAAEQFDTGYQHGGGWQPMRGWKLRDEIVPIIHYPGDRPLSPIAMTRLRDERIYLYPHAFVAIVQPDGSYEIARMD